MVDVDLQLVTLLVGLALLLACVLGIQVVARARRRARLAGDASREPYFDLADWGLVLAAGIVTLGVRSGAKAMGADRWMNPLAFDLATGFILFALFALAAVAGARMVLMRYYPRAARRLQERTGLHRILDVGPAGATPRPGEAGHRDGE